jgi:hypothetical protein
MTETEGSRPQPSPAIPIPDGIEPTGRQLVYAKHIGGWNEARAREEFAAFASWHREHRTLAWDWTPLWITWMKRGGPPNQGNTERQELDTARQEQIKERLLTTKDTLAAIGADFGISRQRIQQIAYRVGIKRRPRRRTAPRHRRG